MIRSDTGWSEVEGHLHRELAFGNFSQAWAFLSRVALLAERQDHHPDWSNSWNRVVLDLVSHDQGAITERDHRFAAGVDALVDEEAPPA